MMLRRPVECTTLIRHPPTMLRVVHSFREAVAELVLPSESLQMLAEGKLREAVDRHRVAPIGTTTPGS
jgi:hypothetical protein